MARTNQSRPAHAQPAVKRRCDLRKEHPIKSLSTTTVKTLAKRGGLVGYTPIMLEQARGITDVFVLKVCTDAYYLSQLRRKKTITKKDVLKALQMNGISILV